MYFNCNSLLNIITNLNSGLQHTCTSSLYSDTYPVLQTYYKGIATMRARVAMSAIRYCVLHAVHIDKLSITRAIGYEGEATP